MMLIYAVDLGTTNIKVALFDGTLHRLALASAPAQYTGDGSRVEFDADGYFDTVIDLVVQTSCAAGVSESTQPSRIVLTGQAESFVLVDAAGAAIRPGISWLDERGDDECRQITDVFGVTEGFRVTGQPTVTTTWPAPKLRWLSTHEPAALAATAHVLMIKDFIAYRLTGKIAAEVSTQAFSYLFDVNSGNYWSEMVEFCGLSERQLPEIISAGTDIGPVLGAVGDRLPRCAGYTVNVGALDHFAAMIGTDSYRPRVVSESAGSVLSLSTLAEPDWQFDPGHLISFHRGIGADDIVLFSCADNGGVVFDWFRNTFGATGYDELERALLERDHTDAPLFLPFLTGTNPPEYYAKPGGAFVNLRLAHDQTDMAYAVQEGVAHLLRSNVDYLATSTLTGIVSSGGGAQSRYWNQLKADICGLQVSVPAEPEAACRGAAVLALVAADELSTWSEAAQLNPVDVEVYTAAPTPSHEQRYGRYRKTVSALYRPDISHNH
jgi:sugar (pentulose or hexulose) kinase